MERVLLSRSDRQEFYLEHYYTFSEQSIKYLTKKCGFDIVEMSKLIEPSGKFTIYAFLKKSLHQCGGLKT